MIVNYNQEPLSENQSDLVPQDEPQKAQYHDRYGELESDASDKFQQHKNRDKVPEPIHLKPQKEDNFLFKFPEAQHQEEQIQERGKSRQGRHGRILIENRKETPQSSSKKHLKIFNLDDEISQKQEDLHETTIKPVDIPNYPQSIPIKVTPSKPTLDNNIEENNSNAWIQHKQDKEQKPEPLFQKKIEQAPRREQVIPQQSKQELGVPESSKLEEASEISYNQQKVHTLEEMNLSKKKRLGNVSSGTSVHLGKGLFYNSVQDGEDGIFKPAVSKESFETGMNMNSSRDEFSSRNMIDGFSPQRKKKKLPSIRPLNENQYRKEQKIFQLQTYDSLNHITHDSKYRRILAHGKYAIMKHDIEEVLPFIYKTIPFDRCLESKLIRNKQCSKLGYIDYDLETKDGLYLLSCKKMPFHLGSTYHISVKKGEFQDKSEHFQGRIRGNFVGSIFNVFTTLSQTDKEKANEMEATIYYNAGWNCCKVGSRDIEIYLKNKSFKYHELDGSEDNSNLMELYGVGDNQKLKKITKYINKKPIWIPEKDTYALNFRGKLGYPSVKNMIIINEMDHSEQALLLAKKDNNEFEFDIQYPFNPLIAMGVAMSSFDFKLASQ